MEVDWGGTKWFFRFEKGNRYFAYAINNSTTYIGTWNMEKKKLVLRETSSSQLSDPMSWPSYTFEVVSDKQGCYRCTTAVGFTIILKKMKK